ncbi:MAG: macro domain-containing protein [Thermotogaceae bacterium]|nr:macro domain-containing protein [Thermotogaceae bacterium]
MILFKDREIELVTGDITDEDTDAIVNAANSYLSHGGGVAAAIIKAGGYEIQRESDEYVKNNGPVPTGKVAVTGAGKLKARYVIHAVGPVWRGGKNDEEKLLKSAVYNSLNKASELNLESISLPAISMGIFGYPKNLGTVAMLQAIKEFFEKNPDSSLKKVRIVNLFDDMTKEFVKASKEVFGV